MLGDVTSAEAVRAAAREFDELGRDEFLRKYGFGRSVRYFARIDGALYDSKALIGAAHGIQHPERGPLTPRHFSGGDSTVIPLLYRLGIEVVDSSEGGQLHPSAMHEVLETICEHLQLRHQGSANFHGVSFEDSVRTIFPAVLELVVGNRAVVRGRTGIGTAADVPWVGLFESDNDVSAQQGFYVVYLFAKDGSAVFLSLNQGTEGVKGGMEVLEKRAIDLRRAAGSPSDLVCDIDLRSTNNRPRKYEAGSALAYRYDYEAIPADEELKAHLNRMLDVRDAATQTGLRWDPAHEPLHLIFKWNADVEPRTIDLHREVAAREGAVWWGRFSSSPTPSIASRKLEALQSQLEDGLRTHAYLYRRGVLWRARVSEVSVTPPSPTDQRFPSYYSRENCNLFVLLSDFEELPSTWLQQNVVLASQPDADPARVASALSNQTTPLFVFELHGVETKDPGVLEEETSVDDEGFSPDDLRSVSLADVCADVAVSLESAGLRFGESHLDFVRASMVSLATKRFLLLTGLSGSGKTRLAIAIGEWFGPDRLEVVAVRPDWTGPDALLGFENGLSKLKDGGHAWTTTRSLEFMLRAARDPGHPYLLVLDEMNLAHVERYFADVLSGMESRSPTVPNLVRDGDEWRSADPQLIAFPSNLFVVGTVNVDETTYMFSPKVLDRANTLEFRVTTEDLLIGSSPISSVEAGPPLLVRRFLEAATAVADDADWIDKSQLGEWLKDLHRALSAHDREFGHRVFLEALRFGALLADAGVSDALVALDLQVLQKVLPKVHGSIRQVAEPLNMLGEWTFRGPHAEPSSAPFDPLDPPDDAAPALPRSFDKVQRMIRRVRANHFVSFAE
jgi:MoxR-like ATPase